MSLQFITLGGTDKRGQIIPVQPLKLEYSPQGLRTHSRRQDPWHWLTSMFGLRCKSGKTLELSTLLHREDEDDIFISLKTN